MTFFCLQCYQYQYVQGDTLCAQQLIYFHTIPFEILQVLMSWSLGMNVPRIKYSDYVLFICSVL